MFNPSKREQMDRNYPARMATIGELDRRLRLMLDCVKRHPECLDYGLLYHRYLGSGGSSSLRVANIVDYRTYIAATYGSDVADAVQTFVMLYEDERRDL